MYQMGGIHSALYSYMVPGQSLLLDEELASKFLPLHSALRRVSQDLREQGVEVLLTVSAGWVTPEVFSVGACPLYQGVAEEHFISALPYRYEGFPALAQVLVEQGADASLPVQLVADSPHLDVGTVVALRALQVQAEVKVVPLSICPLSLRDSYRWGRVVAEVCAMRKERVALIAIGGLSGRWDYRAITAVSPEGKVHDDMVLRVLQSRAWNELLNIDPVLSVRAQAVGGMHHLAVLCGFAHQARDVEVLSYQGIAGTGNAVVRCV